MNPDRTMREMYQATKAKTNLLRNMGYTVVEQWECDFDLQIKHNPELSAYLDSLEVVEPLKPRDAFFGGRTGAASLYYKVDRSKGEEIRYVDGQTSMERTQLVTQQSLLTQKTRISPTTTG